MLIDAIIEDERWEAAGLEGLAERAAHATLAFLAIEARGRELALLGCGDARIAELNMAFRGKSSATNVLSWPASDRTLPRDARPPDPEGAELGDIAVSFDTCAREAAEAGKTLTDHATHLIVHGTLHVMGYDHETDRDAELMERIETEILGKLGIQNPYSVN